MQYGCRKEKNNNNDHDDDDNNKITEFPTIRRCKIAEEWTRVQNFP